MNQIRIDDRWINEDGRWVMRAYAQEKIDPRYFRLAVQLKFPNLMPYHIRFEDMNGSPCTVCDLVTPKDYLADVSVAPADGGDVIMA